MELSKLERLNNIQDEVCSILEENVELRKMNLNLKVQLDLLREREKRNLANTRRLEKIVDNISSLLRDQK
jgi:regulator of replication initiation timing